MNPAARISPGAAAVTRPPRPSWPGPSREDQRRGHPLPAAAQAASSRPGRDRSPGAAGPGRTARGSTADARRGLSGGGGVAGEGDRARRPQHGHPHAPPAPAGSRRPPSSPAGTPTASPASGSVSRRRRCLASSTSRASASSPLLRSTVASRSYGSGAYSGVAATTHSMRRASGNGPCGTRFSYGKPPIAQAAGPRPAGRLVDQVDDLRAGQHDPPRSGRSPRNRSSGV